jgi:hypothetical protein
MNRQPYSLVIIARNAAALLEECIQSVPDAAEVLVVDSGSTDGTPELAARLGARVMHQDWLGYGPQKRFAAEQARHDWVLSLDADERLTPELRASIEKALHAPRAAAYELPRRNRFMGRWLRWHHARRGLRELGGRGQARLAGARRGHLGEQLIDRGAIRRLVGARGRGAEAEGQRDHQRREPSGAGGPGETGDFHAALGSGFRRGPQDRHRSEGRGGREGRGGSGVADARRAGGAAEERERRGEA